VLALGAHDVIAPVRPIVARPSAAVSGPFKEDGEAMFGIHALNATP
jgi:hypothetical protein